MSWFGLIHSYRFTCMEADSIKTYYNQPGVVADYVAGVNRVGL